MRAKGVHEVPKVRAARVPPKEVAPKEEQEAVDRREDAGIAVERITAASARTPKREKEKVGRARVQTA